jgi:hypothetical protein
MPGFLITDGYTAYQQMLPRLAGIDAKAAKRYQAVSGYWHNQRTVARWCRVRGYLDSAAADGITVSDAITAALAGMPWLPLPALPAAA